MGEESKTDERQVEADGKHQDLKKVISDILKKRKIAKDKPEDGKE